MMQRKVYFSLLMMLFVSCMLSAQQPKKEFPTEPNAFIVELKSFFKDATQESAQQSLKTFTDLWAQAQFTADEHDRIIETSNQMLKQRLKPAQEFEAFLNILSAMKTNKLADDKQATFCQALQDILAKQKKDYRDFTETVLLLVTKNELFENAGKRWTTSGSDYTFSFAKEPLITFTKTDLQLYTSGDTSSIFNTKGIFYIGSNKWKGQGGDVYWTRVGFPREQASGKLKRYNLDIRSSEYVADSVSFVFPKVFNKPILGRFAEKATTTHQGEKASYPRFTSYQNVFRLNNVFKNIDYKGGFSLEGDEIKGTGTDSNRAEVTIKYNNKIVLRALSKSFVINPDKLVASKAAVSIYLEKDSIFHSQCVFHYEDKGRKLSISRKEEGLYAAPFSNSYHQVEFQADNINWNIDEDKLEIKSISNTAKEAKFESAFFFTPEKMAQMQGILDYQPITKLRTFFDKHGVRTAGVDEVANFFGNDTKYIENLLFMLAREGFIFFDAEAKQVIEKDKLIHYDNSFNKNEDYDVIKFKSLIAGKPNGTLNLKTYDFIIQGVDNINISDSQQTFFTPKDRTFTLKKNRDMVFSGQVHSGRFAFFGKDFNFKYDTFKVNLLNIDSVKFKFPEYDKEGRVIGMRDIQNSIQNVSGYIYIDQPENKSGRKDMKQYPIFECTKESFVFYDKPSIYNGVYKRKKFFFKVDPFTIENLDKFTAKGLQFPGMLTSADIIPEFQSALSIQEDYSLGFITASPEKGFPLYKGKGTGTGTFMLSNKGFRADAQVDYLISHTNSKNIIFFPDSMNSNSDKFEIPETEGSIYPPMVGKNVYNHWKPYKDSMYIYKRSEPISVYKGKVNFEGFFVLTPVELVGNGITKYQNIVLKSEAFAFFADRVKTKSATLDLVTDASSKAALSATDIMANLDLTKDFATFKTNNDTAKVQLPSNVFATTLNNFTYDLKKQEVEFERSTRQKVDDAYFISNNPEQEALSFTSSKANYSLNDLHLKAQDIPFLLIADSKISTPNNELTIEKNGIIGSIKGANILTSDKNGYHKIYNALVNIFSKSKFTGFGDYDYVDKNKQKFKIYFNDIHTTEEKTTVANGKVLDTSKFYLSPKILYQGNVTMYSTELNLWFDGFVKPAHEFASLHTEWIKMSDTIDPANVLFELKHPVGTDAKDLYTGTFIGVDSSVIYSLLYGKKLKPEDKQIFATEGIFFYDSKQQIFVVGEKNKLNPPASDDPLFVGGNTFELKDAKAEVYTEGVYNFGSKFKVLDLSTAGNYTLDLKTNHGQWEVGMIVNFPFNDDATKFMTNLVLQNSYTLPEIKINGKPTFNAFALMIKDKKDRNKVINELSSFGYLASADAINKTFAITKVKLSYNDSAQAFYSDGDIGLSTITKTGINKSVPGTIMIKSKGEKDQDEFGIFLEPRAEDYVYFKFVGNTLYYLASDLNYVDKVKETQNKTEKMKSGYKLEQAVVDDVAKLKAKRAVN
jgi:hypothetical protein